jgi:hypothetical protein
VQKEETALGAFTRNVASAVLNVAIASSAFAQWPPYPTPRVPKTEDGKPNLEAPAPRTAAGKPDLSGIWRMPPGFAAQSAKPVEPPPGTPPVALFWNIGRGFQDGLPFQPWARDTLKQRMADNSKDNPDAWCLPMGLMQLHNHGMPRKIVQTQELIVIMYEGNYGLRQIFLDGRPLPNNDPQPWWYGYSIGHWEGDTLVVETTGFRDGGWLDVDGSPLTDAAKWTERIRRPTFGRLEIDITIDDPKAYTKPFTVRVNQQVMLDNELIEFICNENEQSTKHFVN